MLLHSVIHFFYDGGLTSFYRIVDGVFKADANIPVTCSIHSRKHQELYVVKASNLSNDFMFERVEETLKDRSYNGNKGRYFISNSIELTFSSNFNLAHGIFPIDDA
jgi:hypothetical protein